MRGSLFRGLAVPLLAVPLLLAGLAGCGADPAEGERGRGGENGGGETRRAGGNSFGGGPPGGALTAVPVEVATVQRRDISSYIETNGTLEAENEVDIVARTAGPIVELNAEEGMPVTRGQLLALIEQDQIRAQREVARVELEETRLAFERAERLSKDDLISVEDYERARAAYESARARFEENKIQLGFTEIRAPFEGLIVTRYVDAAQTVSNGTPLFRISDFKPLLCPIQVPERDLARLRVGQRAYLTVESAAGERFDARVLRISPVVDAATGTVKVTLDVDGRGKLRPGMFARVFLETAVHRGTLVIPRSALSLESIGDTVYAARDGKAERREVMLGFREGNHVEVLSGLEEGEQVVVVGQDGLSDGTPVQALRADGGSVEAPAPMRAAGEPPAEAAGDRGRRPDLSKMSPEQLERAKQFMRARGMTEEQIEQRIRRARERAGSEDGSAGGGDGRP